MATHLFVGDVRIRLSFVWLALVQDLDCSRPKLWIGFPESLAVLILEFVNQRLLIFGAILKNTGQKVFREGRRRPFTFLRELNLICRHLLVCSVAKIHHDCSYEYSTHMKVASDVILLWAIMQDTKYKDEDGEDG